MRLTDRADLVLAGNGSGNGVPTYVELELGEDVRIAIRQVPAALLVEVWAEPWTSRGVEPPHRSPSELRRELGKRARQALRDAPTTRLVPISEAAREWAIPERTLRARIARGALEARWNGRSELALEVPVTTPVRVPLSRSRPDPRFLLLMAQEVCQPGELHRLGYRRRADGECWREASRC
jgi:hypothetical protein